jgi:hypothetical protein
MLVRLYVTAVVGGGDDAVTDSASYNGKRQGIGQQQFREAGTWASWIDYGVTKPPYEPQALPFPTLSNSC